LLETAHLLVGAAALTVLLAAAMQDLRERLIANRLSLALVVLGIAHHLLAAGPAAPAPALLPATLAAAGMFGLGFAAWLAGGIGGGDVKLLTAAGFFVGPDGLGAMVLGTALAGGLIALGCLGIAALPRWAAIWWPGDAARAHTDKVDRQPPATIPYGVAIAAGAAWVILPSLPTVFG
jgi:prepilin peptidase CpaA